MQICPNCVTECEKQSKKMGEYSLWFVCPKCGHRARPDSEFSQMKARGAFSDRLKRRNRNLNQFNYDV